MFSEGCCSIGQGGIGRGLEPHAGTQLGGGDYACGLAVGDVSVNRGAVKLVCGVDEPKPPAMVNDRRQLNDSVFCEGGVGMLSFSSGVKRRAGSSRRAAGVRDLGRKRGSLSPSMVWYVKAS